MSQEQMRANVILLEINESIEYFLLLEIWNNWWFFLYINSLLKGSIKKRTLSTGNTSSPSLFIKELARRSSGCHFKPINCKLPFLILRGKKKKRRDRETFLHYGSENMGPKRWIIMISGTSAQGETLDSESTSFPRFLGINRERERK